MTQPPLLNDLLLLNVSFDINQLGSGLCWNVIDESNRRNLLSPVGRHAGAVHLEKGDKVNVCVTAYSGPDETGRPREFGGFDIVDCTLQSVPRLRERDTFYAPSPFQSANADSDGTAIHIAPFVPAAPDSHGYDKALNAYYWRQVSQNSVDVDKELGIWELSLVLVVRIVPLAPDISSHQRVFRFDPEAEVGTGTHKNL